MQILPHANGDFFFLNFLMKNFIKVKKVSTLAVILVSDCFEDFSFVTSLVALLKGQRGKAWQ